MQPKCAYVIKSFCDETDVWRANIFVGLGPRLTQKFTKKNKIVLKVQFF